MKYVCFRTAFKQALGGLFIFSSCFLAQNSFADSADALPAFVATDRVLILAPQPDDETIGVGGAIQRALKAGSTVQVVLLTNGENNKYAFMVYEKSWWIGPQDVLRMGEVRRQESVTALTRLGLSEKDVISLGYPDRGTLEILTRHWDPADPYRNTSAHVEKVPYARALSPGSPYSGESVLTDLERILSDYKPTKIFVSHPADANPDHQALYLFLRVALWDLDGTVGAPEIYPYLVHTAQWPEPRGYYPDLASIPPPVFAVSEIHWQSLSLTYEEITRKYTAIQDYPSQIKYAPDFLISFARENEFFGDYPVVKICRATSSGEVGKGLSNSGIAWSHSLDGRDLLVRVPLKRKINKMFGVSLSLLPYKKGVLFSAMPKVEIRMGLGGLRVKDQVRDIDLKGVRFTSRDKEMEFRIPWSLLGDPDYILSSAKTAFKDLTADEMAWRILLLE